jgi:hypothetical protein
MPRNRARGVLACSRLTQGQKIERPTVALQGYGAAAFDRFATKCLGWLARPKLAKRAKAGAARGIRTPDPVITNDVLYQLSYCGELSGLDAVLISPDP